MYKRQGLLYRTGDEADLTRTLERVAAGADLATIRKNAVRTAQRYHPERTAERLHRALEQVTGRAYSARCADSPTRCACCSPAPRRAG